MMIELACWLELTPIVFDLLHRCKSMYTHYDNELQLCHLSTRYQVGGDFRAMAEDDATNANAMISADGGDD